MPVWCKLLKVMLKTFGVTHNECTLGQKNQPLPPPPGTISTPTPPHTVPSNRFKTLYSSSYVLGVNTPSVWCGLCLWKALEDNLKQILDTHLQQTKRGNTAQLSSHTSSTGDCYNPRDKPRNISEPNRNWIPICTPTKRKWLRVQALASTTCLSSSGTVAQWQS